MTGLGGDAFWLIHDGASGEVRYLNGGGKAAAGATIVCVEGAWPGRNPAARHGPGNADGAGRGRELDRGA